MYHKKKEMGMGGMNMPKPMKKPMPGGGMVSPMRMEMGMGGKNMPKLMKKGGKTFPDLTGDGKVTRADILAGRGVIGKKKKKSMASGGRNDDPPSFADRLSSNLLNAAELALGGPLAYIYRRYMEDRAREAAESARPDQDPYGFVGPVMPRDDMTGPTQEDEPRPSRSIRRMPIRVEPIEPRRVPEIVLPRNRQIIVPDDGMRRKLPRDPFVIPDELRGMAYGGKVKLMKKGGTVDYFAGGALAAGLGQFAQRSQNPLIQGIGKVASTVGGMTPGGRAVNMAANFLPSGNPMAALGQLMRRR